MSAAVVHEVAGTAPFRIASREVDANTGIHQLGDDGVGGDSHADQDQALRHAPTVRYRVGAGDHACEQAPGREEVQVQRLGDRRRSPSGNFDDVAGSGRVLEARQRIRRRSRSVLPRR